MSTSALTVQVLRSNQSFSLPVRSIPAGAEWIVPELTDERLAILMETIKPVHRANDGALYYIKDVDPKKASFTWKPAHTRPADGLVEIGTSFTFHTCGYHGYFKPSIAEVLAQVPLDILNQVVAFETELPEHDNWREVTSPSADKHRGVTTWYKRKDS